MTYTSLSLLALALLTLVGLSAATALILLYMIRRDEKTYNKTEEKGYYDPFFGKAPACHKVYDEEDSDCN